MIASFSDGTLIPASIVLGADGPRSKVREFAMSGADKASVSKFPIWHNNMTVCYGDAEKARYLRSEFPTSYLALSERSFHAFQSSESVPVIYIELTYLGYKQAFLQASLAPFIAGKTSTETS